MIQLAHPSLARQSFEALSPPEYGSTTSGGDPKLGQHISAQVGCVTLNGPNKSFAWFGEPPHPSLSPSTSPPLPAVVTPFNAGAPRRRQGLPYAGARREI